MYTLDAGTKGVVAIAEVESEGERWDSKPPPVRS